MKKCWMMVLCLFLLCGCGADEPMETVGDELLIPVLAPAKELNIQLPEDVAKQVISSEDGESLYFGDGYSLAVQTLRSGDLERTVQAICGYEVQQLTIMGTRLGAHDRYDWTFACAGEGGNQVGRAAILDDGSYHYCVSVMADESCSGVLEQQWDKIFSSMSLSEGAINQGS